MKLVNVRDEPNAVHILYEFLRERSTEDDPHVNISHRALPSFEDHAQFVSHAPYYVWYLVCVTEMGHDRWMTQRYVGYVSITFRNEIGIILTRESRGKGYGKRALKLLLEQHQPLPAIPSQRPRQFVANIAPGNERSIRLFTGLGFHLIQKTFAYEPPKEE